MLINIRGTSGSGKSHIIRQVMEAYGGKDSFIRQKLEGRKQPLAYFKTNDETHRFLYIPGHYETACGGCDTIHGNDTIFDLVRKAHGNGYDVLFEGLILSVEFNRTLLLAQECAPVRVFAINIPLEECLASINFRRQLKNPDAPDVNPVNSKNKWQQTQRAMERLKLAGVDARMGNREEVLAWTKESLRVH